ncbi:4-hydroxy-2-oxovalerate aldolase [Neptuniibacter pectenicola]|jgi:4-hydroxy 2-oxovalerate aldolase|uniref:4-hydroxy-2-oxovalerate aldolase n=1 Tax=Neptuniibacter pectenicola TaxID=1806669 RepID=UPI0030EC4C72
MNDSRKIIFSDTTLRDGNHALQHQLTEQQIQRYCTAIDKAGVDIVEVGHGNGLGASSLQVGLSKVSDSNMLTIAREYLKQSKLGVHVIPGFATLERDIKPAIECGVDVFRIASHCTEADITEKHITFCRSEGRTVFGVLMMSHMVDKETLYHQAKQMQIFGAEAIILMDSAGNYLPDNVIEKVGYLVDRLEVAVGFHAHNNLGLSVANSIAAVQSGASIIDGCVRGFGAGAGNTQIEVLAAVFDLMGFKTGVNLFSLLDAADLAEECVINKIPTISSDSIISGMAGVFSGFLKPVKRIAEEYHVDSREVFLELGARKVLAGQEDLIIEVAKDLKEKSNE